MCLTGCKNSEKPSAGSDAGAACDGGAAACSKCCCCVTSVAIKNVRAFNNGSQFGHQFDFEIKMTFASGSAGKSDCVLEWWEKTNVPALTGHSPNTWTDMFANFSTSPTFDPWNNRTVPCPGGGPLTVTIMDPPALGIRPGRTTKRTLEFRLKVKSGGGCSCGSAEASATATQVLEIVNGVPTGSGTYTTP